MSDNSPWNLSDNSLAALDAEMLAAHAAGDKAALVTLHLRAAEALADDNAACFHLTQAYVYALDAGDDRAAALKSRLMAAGRET